MKNIKDKNDFIREALEVCNKGICLWEETTLEVITDLMFEYGWQKIDANGCSTIWCVTTLEWIYNAFHVEDPSIKEKKLSIFVNSIEKMDFDEYWKWYYEKMYNLGFDRNELIYFMKIVDTYGLILSQKIEKMDIKVEKW